MSLTAGSWSVHVGDIIKTGTKKHVILRIGATEKANKHDNFTYMPN